MPDIKKQKETINLTAMRSRVFGFLIVLTIASPSFAQIVISAGGAQATELATSSGTQIAINNNFLVNSDGADFSKATLLLVGTDQTLTNGRTGSAIALGGLIVGGGGTKNLTGGTWEIAGSLVFDDGIIVPQTGSDGKIVHTLANASLGDILVNNPNSYVNGIFHSKGTGDRFFPIGNSSGSFPSQLSNVTQGDLEIGMRVINSDAGLTGGSDIQAVFDDQYWELIDPSNSLVGPGVALSSLGADAAGFIEPGVGTVIFGAADTNSEGTSLGGAQSGNLIIGNTAIKTTDRIFTFARISSNLVDVKIHNVVTPFQDNANDYLVIENIDIFPDNKVRLLDRWGVLVKEWSGFANVTGNPNPVYDLSKIATGNYICIVEYKDGSTGKNLSQMVTIINQ